MSPVAIGEDELESLPIHTMGAFISETSAADPHPAQNFPDTQLKLSFRKLMSVMARIADSTRTSHSFPLSANRRHRGPLSAPQFTGLAAGTL